MEYLIQKEDTTIKLNKDHQNDIVSDIVSKWDTLDGQRADQKEKIKDLEERVFECSDSDDEEYKSTDFFELYQTLKSQLWQNIYTDIEGMFEVYGTDTDTDNNKNLQKANLVRQLEKSKFNRELDKCIDNLILKSEFITFTGWKRVEKQVRRQIDEPQFDFFGLNIGNKKVIKVINEVEYNGVDVKAIDPLNFVYDLNGNQFKIYRTWATVDKIKSDKNLNLSKSDILDLQAMIDDSEEANNIEYINRVNGKQEDDPKAVKGKEIEILEFWGDFKLKNGVELKNYLITVVGRKFVARLESNPYVIDPFVICSILKDPKTQRGYLYLSSVFDAVDYAQEIYNKQLKALALTINKPYLAPKGAMSSRDEINAGDIIEYDPTLMTQPPRELTFESRIGFDYVQYFKSLIETTTGIYKNMSGAVEKYGTTATEVQARVSGQTARLSMIIDTIFQDGVIPTIEKVAEINANYNFDDEQILINEQGMPQTAVINEGIRQGKYKYQYADRGAVQEKRMRLKEVLPILQQMVPALAPLGFDMKEFSKDTLEQLGYENVERFFNNANQLQQQPNINAPQLPTTGGMEDLQGISQGLDVQQYQ